MRNNRRPPVRRAMLLVIAAAAMQFVCETSVAQDFDETENKTYEYYQNELWDSLIYAGEKALDENLDYFYLRLRLGIAYFQRENYRKAAHHLSKAYAFNSSDPVMLERLYLSYIYTNRDLEARRVYLMFPSSLKEKYSDAGNMPVTLFSGFGSAVSNNIANNEMKRQNQKPADTSLTFSDLNGNRQFMHAGFRLIPHRSFLLSGNYTYLGISKKRQILAPRNVISGYINIPDNGWYYTDTLYKKESDLHSDDYRLHQHQFYLSSKVNPGGGFILIPSFHLLSIRYETILPVAELRNAQSLDTLPSLVDYSVRYADTGFVNYIGSLGIIRSFPYLDVGLTGSWSDINGNDQVQIEPSVVVYPLGNLDLYLHTSVLLQIQDQETAFLFRLMGGRKLFERLWMELEARAGKINNFHENNGLAVYNSGDDLLVDAGTNLYLLISEKLRLNLSYSFASFEGKYYVYPENRPPEINKFNYYNHIITGGISWKL